MDSVLSGFIERAVGFFDGFSNWLSGDFVNAFHICLGKVYSDNTTECPLARLTSPDLVLPACPGSPMARVKLRVTLLLWRSELEAGGPVIGPLENIGVVVSLVFQ